MYKYLITFLALSDTISFEIKSSDKEVIENIIYKLLFIFSDVDTERMKIEVETFHQNSVEIRNKINLFVTEFNSELPQINAVSAFFRRIGDKEHFFFLPNIKLDQKESLELFNHLNAINENNDSSKSNEQFLKTFGVLLDKYKIKAFGPKRVIIGERDKSKRICRFCNNTKQPIEFKNESHAITEGLGNKTIILLEECDICNDDFSKTIEPDIIQYLSLFRTFFDVKGKGGSKEFRGANFSLKNEGSVKVQLFSLEERPEKNMLPYKIKLETKDAISFQNIYKCFCKFFLSVIDKSELSSFTETIKWINGEKNIRQLPKIGELLSYHGFTKQPKIITYIRKDDDFNLPYAVGEFYFTCLIFVFIIPLSSNDNKDFLNKTDFNNFWKTFKHYDNPANWKFVDYSDDSKRKLLMNLNFDTK